MIADEIAHAFGHAFKRQEKRGRRKAGDDAENGGKRHINIVDSAIIRGRKSRKIAEMGARHDRSRYACRRDWSEDG